MSWHPSSTMETKGMYSVPVLSRVWHLWGPGSRLTGRGRPGGIIGSGAVSKQTSSSSGRPDPGCTKCLKIETTGHSYFNDCITTVNKNIQRGMNEGIAQEGDCLLENNLSLKAFSDRRRRPSYTVILLWSCSEFSLRKFPHRAQPGV